MVPGDRSPRMRPGGRYLLLALGLAAAHAFVFFRVFVILFTRAEHYGRLPPPPSPILTAAAAVLGAPLFYLPQRWSLALRPVLGDDSVIFIAQVAVNGLLWGGAIAAGIYFARHRRRRGAGLRQAAV
jgi:hypothetical protein